MKESKNICNFNPIAALSTENECEMFVVLSLFREADMSGDFVMKAISGFVNLETNVLSNVRKTNAITDDGITITVNRRRHEYRFHPNIRGIVPYIWN